MHRRYGPGVVAGLADPPERRRADMSGVAEMVPGEERDLRIHAGACSQRYRHLSASLLALHRRIGRIELWIVAALVTVIGGLGGMTWALVRMAIEG